MTEFLREEDQILKQLADYIDGTYTAHYKTDGELQTVDIWESLGIAEDVCRAMIIKYVMRFGKKDGKNLKDLYKAMHYLVLMVHYAKQHHENDEQATYDYSTKGSDTSWFGCTFTKTIAPHEAEESLVDGVGYIPERPKKKCQYNFFSKRFWKKDK